MRRDIDIIKERVFTIFPDMKIEQLKVSHPGTDDDGLWFFRHPSKTDAMQIESATYNLPFSIEAGDSRETAASIEDVVMAVQRYFAA